MSTHVKVYPTKESALNVHHPIGTRSHCDGALWPYDVFTCRRLSDGSFTEDESKAFKPALPKEGEEKPGAASPGIVARPMAAAAQSAPIDGPVSDKTETIKSK